MCSLSLTGFEASSYAAETFVLHGIATHRRSRVEHYICVYEAWACGVGGPAGSNTRSGRQCAAMSLGGICVVQCLISIGCLLLLFLTEGRAITRMYRHMRVFPLLHCCFRLHIAGDLCHLWHTHFERLYALAPSIRHSMRFGPIHGGHMPVCYLHCSCMHGLAHIQLLSVSGHVVANFAYFLSHSSRPT